MPYQVQVSDSTQLIFAGTYNIVVNSVYAYFFFTYGWNNPDIAKNGSCWATNANSIGSSVELDDRYNNVSSEFVTWFRWGFAISMCMIVIGCL